MSNNKLKSTLNMIDGYIQSGNYKLANELLRGIDKGQLTEAEKKIYSDFERILKSDKMYLLVFLGLIAIIILYFIIVKQF